MAPCNKEDHQASPVQYKERKEDPAQNGIIKRELKKCEAKGSIDLELGTYKASRTPLAILVIGFSWVYYCTYTTSPDPRAEGFFFLDNAANIFFLCTIYILFSLTWGPRLMEHRQPIKLKKVIMVYNLFQVLMCSYMFVELGLVGWWGDYNWFCEPHDYSFKPKSVRLVNVAYMFFFSKVLDFADTLFFILNKKWAHVSLLHVVHHSSMCLTMWFGTKYTSVGHLSFLGYLNSGVHVLMYSYYFLAAMGPSVQPYLWWKKYLTTIQLVQFICIFLHTTQIFFNGCPNVPRGLAFLTCIYATIYFGLFIDFYIKTYTKKHKAKTITHEKTKSLSSNGQTISDTFRNPSSLLASTCLRERSNGIIN